MLQVLSVTFPFFALVLAGFVAIQRRMLPLEAIPGLNGFVLYFALPCMLYRFGASSPISQLLDPTLFLAYLQRWHQGLIPYTYQDQAMDPAVGHAMCEAADPVAAFAADTTLWGELASDPRLIHALRDAYERVCAFTQGHVS